MRAAIEKNQSPMQKSDIIDKITGKAYIRRGKELIESFNKDGLFQYNSEKYFCLRKCPDGRIIPCPPMIKTIIQSRRALTKDEVIEKFRRIYKTFNEMQIL